MAKGRRLRKGGRRRYKGVGLKLDEGEGGRVRLAWAEIEPTRFSPFCNLWKANRKRIFGRFFSFYMRLREIVTTWDDITMYLGPKLSCFSQVNFRKTLEILFSLPRPAPMPAVSSCSIFSRVHATQQVTMSVCWSVGRSVPLYFFCIFQLFEGR